MDGLLREVAETSGDEDNLVRNTTLRQFRLFAMEGIRESHVVLRATMRALRTENVSVRDRSMLVHNAPVYLAMLISNRYLQLSAILLALLWCGCHAGCCCATLSRRVGAGLQMRLAALYVCRSLNKLKKFRCLLLTKQNLQTVVEQTIAPGKPLPGPAGAAKDLRSMGRRIISGYFQHYEEESVALDQAFRFAFALTVDSSPLWLTCTSLKLVSIACPRHPG